jgi:hypothetical protein
LLCGAITCTIRGFETPASPIIDAGGEKEKNGQFAHFLFVATESVWRIWLD